MKKTLLIIFIILISGNIFTQVIEKFKDPSMQKWGLKIKESDSIILPAIFPRIFDYNDSLIIVNDFEKGMAVYKHSGQLLIDYDNKTLFTFMDLKFGNCPYDSITHRKLFDIPMFNPRQEGNMRGYEINLNRECIPNDYFPCPAWVKTKFSDSTPEYIKLLQKGEEYSWMGKIDSAIFMCKKAIDLQPNNPSVYHWGASLFVRDYYTSNGLVKKASPIYHDWIMMCIDNALQLENIGWYRLTLLRMKKFYYKDHIRDKKSVNLVDKEINEL